MKDIAFVFLATLPTVLCLGVAGVLAFYDRSGWGWFLLIAAIIAPTKWSMK